MPDLVPSSAITDLTPATPGVNLTPGLPGVNVVQSPNLSPSLPTGAAILPPGSLTAEQALALQQNADKRVRDLQSIADKAVADRQSALVQIAELQKQLTDLQAQSTNTLSSAADATQAAMNRATTAEAEKARLEGELRRALAVQKHPHLLPYAKFIPATGTEEEQQKAIEELNAIREEDLKRITGGQPPLVANPTPGVPQNQVNPMLNPFQNVYGNRPNVNPMAASGQMPTIPGSTPATMSPAGAGTTSEAIGKMLADAMSDPVKYAQVLEQAKVLANQGINEQLGRS